MNDLDTSGAFRGLPLTPQQNSEIRHYIHCRERSGLPWDTPELASMLHDMLHPPELEQEARGSIDGALDRERGVAHDDANLDGDTPRD